MVSGYPLQYCNPLYKPFIPQGFPEYKYPGYYGMMEISEEVMMPTSPRSVQSDSDTSLSSTDVPRIPSSPLPSKPKTSSEVKCGWRQCGLWFESLDQLATHVSKAHASSGPSGLFYCGWEGCTRNMKGFNARYKMLVHVRTHTNEKPHRCFQCDKSFSRAENLKIHSRSHSGEKPYVCPIPGCGKAYSNSSDRFKHTRTHQVDKPYECKVPGCVKRYTDPSSLRKHVKTYKHEGVVNKLEEKEEKMNNYDEKVINFEEKINMDCKCSHGCCLKSCLTKAAEIFKLGALFGNTGIDSWNKFLIQQSDYRNNEVMDCDGPLDLTVHRK